MCIDGFPSVSPSEHVEITRTSYGLFYYYANEIRVMNSKVTKESDLQTRRTLLVLVRAVWKLEEHARRCQTAREAWKPSSLSLWDFDKQHLVTKKRKRDQTLAHDARWDFGAHGIISMVCGTALMSVPYDSSAFATETRGFNIAHRRNRIQNAT